MSENQALIKELPLAALVNEAAFCDYVTRGTHHDRLLAPSVFEISAKARLDLFHFMHERVHFDMDVSCFDNFNEAFRRDHPQNA